MRSRGSAARRADASAPAAAKRSPAGGSALTIAVRRGRAIRVGVIADTHGLLRGEAVAALRGVELIIHAGDIGNPEVLQALRAIAPTFAVRGNIDTGSWAAALPETGSVRVGELAFWVLHDISLLDAPGGGYAAVIHGHSHRPLVAVRDRVLYLNPGSAGPRRFRLPVSLARLLVCDRSIRTEIVTLLAHHDGAGAPSSGRRISLPARGC
jgi:putative phosphoesterase